MAAGKVYDEDELKRIQTWLDLQDSDFVSQDRVKDKKEIIFSTLILVTASVLIIGVVYKLTKK